jgi:hypothetical protein
MDSTRLKAFLHPANLILSSWLLWMNSQSMRNFSALAHSFTAVQVVQVYMNHLSVVLPVLSESME